MTEDTLDASVDQVATTWWLGFWRAGDSVYWWTTAVSPTADRRRVRAAVRARVSPSTWRRTTDPATSSGRSGSGGPVQAAFVAAGAVPWTAVQPALDALARAVPVQGDPAIRQQADLLARRLRRARDVAKLSVAATANDEKIAALLAEQIGLAFDAGRLNREAVMASLDRAWSGPLVDPDANRRLCHELVVLLPDVLREFLAAATTTATPATVVIAPSPELGLVPWELLPVDDDVRLIERAAVRGGISPATVAHLALPAAEDRPDLPGLLILDPAGQAEGGDTLPIYPGGLPAQWAAAERAARGDVIVGRRPPEPHDGSADGDRADQGCSRGQLSHLLHSRAWGRLVFHGHVSAGDALSPTAAALLLTPDPDGAEPPVVTDDGRALEQANGTSQLSARVWLYSPQRWPMPRRVAFIACQADDAGYVEQTGLTLAAVNAGARTVIATRWSLPTDATARTSASLPPADGEAGSQEHEGRRPTTDVALAVDRALAAADPMTVLRQWQLAELAAWRTADTTATRRAHAPLLWAALVGYVLPDTLEVTPFAHDGSSAGAGR
jgi:hypothetical protein